MDSSHWRVALAACFLVACGTQEPPSTLGSQGSTLATTVLLLPRAAVDVSIVNATTAVVRVSNTSPSGAATTVGGPVLTRVGFNLSSGPTQGCLTLDNGGDRWELVTDPEPYCGEATTGGAGGPATTVGTSAFAYSIEARPQALEHGLASGQTANLRVRVDPECDPDFVFTNQAFATAVLVLMGDEEGQWAAAFEGQEGDATTTCTHGRFPCRPVHTWSELVATAGDMNGLPSLYANVDGRAGSLELNFNGGEGFDGITSDPPYEAALVTLRNGTGQKLEQTLYNRTFTPAKLAPDGCSIGYAYDQCWIFAPDDLQGQRLRGYLPSKVVNSNVSFDVLPSDRVQVSGGATVDYRFGDTFADNRRESFTVTWKAPRGIHTAQILLRGRYDKDLDDLGPEDGMVTLFRRNFPASLPDMSHPSVRVLAESPTVLVIGVNVQDALEAVCGDYFPPGTSIDVPPANTVGD